MEGNPSVKLLKKFNEEIIAIVVEDNLEEEVKQANAVQEKIEFSLIDLEKALGRGGIKSGTTKSFYAKQTSTPTKPVLSWILLTLPTRINLKLRLL